MKKALMMKQKFFLISLFVISTFLSLSQTRTITGTVTNSSGEALAGASVRIDGTTNGSITGSDGQFRLDDVSPDDYLLISYIGTEAQRLLVGDQQNFSISLESSAEFLDEVVVIAYGEQRRANVSGAISTVDSEEIAALPVTNAESALQGRAPGIQVTNSGSPGATPRVLIRGLGTLGNTDPIYVIDGVIVGNLSGISPNDIESVSLLKDASTTALYGARGANGVVIVTTKRGQEGKGKLEFNTYTGVQAVTERLNVLNTVDYLNHLSDLNIFPDRPFELYQNNTDWQNAVFQNGMIQDYQVNYSGATENLNYYISGEYLGQEGSVIETAFERFSFRAKGDGKFGRFTVGQNLGVSFGTRNPERESGGRTALEHALKMAPYLPVYNPTNLGGFQGPDATDGQDAENPVRVMEIGESEQKTLGIIGNVFGEFQILDGLSFRSQVGLDYFSNNDLTFVPSFADGSAHSQNFAAVSRGNGLGRTLIYNNILRYETSLNKLHNFEVIALSEKTESRFEGLGGSSRNDVTDEIQQLNVANAQSLGSGVSETNRLGYVGRVNYNFQSKYIASASLRRDASSRFGANKRWGTFYSGSLAWNVAREDFLLESPISTMKIRGSYGITGTDAIADYGFSAQLVDPFQYIFNGQTVVGVTPAGGENPDLQWEEKAITNIGLDFGFFEDRIYGLFEWYDNTSNELLIPVPLTSSLGTHNDTADRNVGSVSTNGIELQLGYANYDNKFTWDINGNIATVNNNVRSIGDRDPILQDQIQDVNGSSTRVAVGEPLYHFYGLIYDGVYANQEEVDQVLFGDPNQLTVGPGDARFVDLNGDGFINSEDQTVLGNRFPDFTYGFNLNASYKGFDFNAFINGVSGNDIYNLNKYLLEGGLNRGFNVGQEYYENRWTPNNTEGTFPRVGGNNNNNSFSSRWIEDGSFTRLKNISLGYRIPTSLIGKYVSRMRVYASGQNLITVTDYSGYDPEVAGNLYGIDEINYPQPKSGLVGIQLQF